MSKATKRKAASKKKAAVKIKAAEQPTTISSNTAAGQDAPVVNNKAAVNSVAMARSSASIIEKLVIKGTLVTMSPLLIGAGESDGVIDTLLLKDKQERPFIPGSSLAGVLRENIFRRLYDRLEIAEALFGETAPQSGQAAMQSALSVDDVLLKSNGLVVRDGVGIDSFTGVGIDGRKYDYEALERGAEGDFYIVVTLRQCHLGQKDALEKAVRDIADLMMSGIHVGALTTKGFGRIEGRGITVTTYDFSQPQALKAWLLETTEGCAVYQAKCRAEQNENDFVLEAQLAIDGSLIVRTLPEDDDKQADGKQLAAVQLKSGQDYVLPGTSVKGVIRQQAMRIFSKLGKAESLLDDLMGYSTNDKKQKSRLYTEEIYFRQGVKPVCQTRNRIDRFTGGTIDSALFTNEPLWQEQAGQPTLCLRLRIIDCKPWEAGLILFVLRDIWTGRVAFGGEKSVGRGYLSGVSAAISYHGQYHLATTKDGKLAIKGDRSKLEEYAAALRSEEAAG